ncbi:hypothetical protein [Paenarthrobacter sp. NPDC089316]|uniref:hypothetical protein n=1 Tax=unclassified Paenarthrobacter TaxID=2634190 RepID=UPI0034166894
MKISLAHLRPVSSDPARLRERWKVASRSGGWRFNDWWVPEVEALIQANVVGASLGAAARQLGTARAYNGVGIGETMLDFRAFFAAADLPSDEDSMQALVEGWVAENEHLEDFPSCTDITNGLVAVSHFEMLVKGLSTGSKSMRDEVTLVTVYLECSHKRPLPWLLTVEIGLAFGAELSPVHAVGAVHEAEVHVILPRSDIGYSALMRFVGMVEKLVSKGTHVRVGFRDVPDSPEQGLFGGRRSR